MLTDDEQADTDHADDVNAPPTLPVPSINDPLTLTVVRGSVIDLTTLQAFRHPVITNNGAIHELLSLHQWIVENNQRTDPGIMRPVTSVTYVFALKEMLDANKIADRHEDYESKLLLDAINTTLLTPHSPRILDLVAIHAAAVEVLNNEPPEWMRNNWMNISAIISGLVALGAVVELVALAFGVSPNNPFDLYSSIFTLLSLPSDQRSREMNIVRQSLRYAIDHNQNAAYTAVLGLTFGILIALLSVLIKNVNDNPLPPFDRLAGHLNRFFNHPIPAPVQAIEVLPEQDNNRDAVPR